MDVCENCGSGARNKYGFCEGCGARWRLASSQSSAIAAAPSQPGSTYAKLPAEMSSIGLIEVRGKQVWVAVLLAVLFGPFGLLYCTIPGTIVMLILSIILNIWLGDMSFLIILPLCALWAWRAAREYSSGFD